MNCFVHGISRLHTTLCLQYKPHYIAAGSIFLAAKILKVKLPKEKGRVWWMQFDVAPKRLEGSLIYFFNPSCALISAGLHN